jgi:hypothetical protein
MPNPECKLSRAIASDESKSLLLKEWESKGLPPAGPRTTQFHARKNGKSREVQLKDHCIYA